MAQTENAYNRKQKGVLKGDNNRYMEGEIKMSEKQKQVINTFNIIIPKLSRENLDYLLGFGEGMAIILEQNKREEEKETDCLLC